MGEGVATVLFFVVGVLNLIPTVVAVAPSRAASLYGVPSMQPPVELVIRHRALLLGAVGMGLLGASFMPAIRLAAVVFAVYSKLGFLVLVAATPAATPQLRKVAGVDIAALLALAVAVAVAR